MVRCLNLLRIVRYSCEAKVEGQQGEALPIIYHFYFLRIINKKKNLAKCTSCILFHASSSLKGDSYELLGFKLDDFCYALELTKKEQSIEACCYLSV